LLAIVDADVLRPTYGFAIRPIFAWLTEIGGPGNADKHKVGVGRPHLLAEPTWRTIFLAMLRANPLSHVLYAPP